MPENNLKEVAPPKRNGEFKRGRGHNRCKVQGRPEIQVSSEHPDVLFTERPQGQDKVCGTPGPLSLNVYTELSRKKHF